MLMPFVILVFAVLVFSAPVSACETDGEASYGLFTYDSKTDLIYALRGPNHCGRCNDYDIETIDKRGNKKSLFPDNACEELGEWDTYNSFLYGDGFPGNSAVHRYLSGSTPLIPLKIADMNISLTSSFNWITDFGYYGWGSYSYKNRRYVTLSHPSGRKKTVRHDTNYFDSFVRFYGVPGKNIIVMTLDQGGNRGEVFYRLDGLPTPKAYKPISLKKASIDHSAMYNEEINFDKPLPVNAYRSVLSHSRYITKSLTNVGRSLHGQSLFTEAGIVFLDAQQNHLAITKKDCLDCIAGRIVSSCSFRKPGQREKEQTRLEKKLGVDWRERITGTKADYKKRLQNAYILLKNAKYEMTTINKSCPQIWK